MNTATKYAKTSPEPFIPENSVQEKPRFPNARFLEEVKYGAESSQGFCS